MINIDPHDALLWVTPPRSLYPLLEKVDLGHHAGGFDDRWKWHDSEVWKIPPDICTAIYWLVKGVRGVDSPAEGILVALRELAYIGRTSKVVEMKRERRGPLGLD